MVLSIVAYSVILTWVYVGTGGSVLMTALFHAGLNAVAPIMAGVDHNTEWIIRNVLAGLIAVVVVLSGGLRPAQPAVRDNPERISRVVPGTASRDDLASHAARTSDPGAANEQEVDGPVTAQIVRHPLSTFLCDVAVGWLVTGIGAALSNPMILP